MASMIVPPGGFAAFAQMTPASRAALSGVSARTASPRRRRRKVKSTSARRRAPARAKRSARKLKFGSPAWQKKYRVGKYRKK